MKHNSKKCIKILLVLTDVDGVLTDGGRYYSAKGEISKKFHTRDGMGVNLLLRNGIKTVIITKEKSLIVKKWAKDMNVTATYEGAIKKELFLSKLCKRFGITSEEIAYIGDDVNDIELMKRIGFSGTPNDGIMQAKRTADHVCKANGGKGAFREFADIILSSKFPNKKNWY